MFEDYLAEETGLEDSLNQTVPTTWKKSKFHQPHQLNDRNGFQVFKNFFVKDSSILHSMADLEKDGSQVVHTR